MKRTTIFIPETLERDLQGYARRAGKPVAWVVREALSSYVAGQKTAARMPSFVGIGSSDRSDIAMRHEELLWTDPHGETATAVKRRRARPKRKTARAR